MDRSRIRSTRLARRLEAGLRRIEGEGDTEEKEKLVLFWLDLLSQYEIAYDDETKEGA